MKCLTWRNINGTGKHRDKGIEGVLVEGVDLVQAVQQEEQHCASGSHSPVLHRRNVPSVCMAGLYVLSMVMQRAGNTNVLVMPAGVNMAIFKGLK